LGRQRLYRLPTRAGGVCLPYRAEPSDPDREIGSLNALEGIKFSEQGAAMRLRNAVAMLLAVALGLAACEGMQRPDSQASPNSGATNRCAFDSDCMGGSCEFGTCSPFKRPNACRFDSDCGRLQQCVLGSCSQKFGACNFDSDCSYGEECRGSSCWRKMNGCNFNSDCMSGSCIAGSCM